MVRETVIAVVKPSLAAGRRVASDAVAATEQRVSQAAVAAFGPPLHAVERRGSRAALELLDRLLASELAEAAARRIVTSQVAEQAVADAFEGPLVDAVARRLLESEELWLIVQEVAQSPAVTDAIQHQSADFAEEVAEQVREQTQDADAWLERVARRMLRRNPAAPPSAPAIPGGLGPA
jgi:hypothetical protein